MANRCPLCNVDNKPSARFCGTCGTSLPGDDSPEQEEPYSLPVRIGVGLVGLFCECFPGFFSPMTLIMSILAAFAGFAVIGLAGFIIGLGAVLSGFMIGAMGVIFYWTACVWLICGYLCLPSEGLADMRGLQWWAFFVVGFGPFVAGLAMISMAGA